jgi:hypothetical protein
VSLVSDSRRLAIVLAAHRAVPPPGIEFAAFAAACRADTYEVLAGLNGVVSGIAGPAEDAALLWPGSVHLPEAFSVRAVADWAADRFDVAAVVPADAPDLPQLVIAKVFKALVRAQLCLAPERGGAGLVAIGLQLPWPAWLPDDMTLDDNRFEHLAVTVPHRRWLASAPDWHRLRTPGATDHLDPGLEGWEETRALLAGRPLSGDDRN